MHGLRLAAIFCFALTQICTIETWSMGQSARGTRPVKSADAELTQEILNEHKNREAALEAEYIELMNTYDPLYLADDPVCRGYREIEIRAHEEKQVAENAERERIENLITGICRQTPTDAYKLMAHRTLDASKKVIMAEDFSGLANRIRHKALSQEAYDILSYDRLNEVLDTQCHYTHPDAKKYFKMIVITEDVFPAVTGAGSGVVVGWFVFRGLGRAVWVPARSALIARGASDTTFRYLKYAGWLLAGTAVTLPMLKLFIVDSKDYEEKLVREDEARLESRIALEATFPEPRVQIAERDCHEMIANSDSAPSQELKDFWADYARTKCQLYSQAVKYALNSLSIDEFNRCHPGNRGAAERIQKNYDNFVAEHPQFALHF